MDWNKPGDNGGAAIEYYNLYKAAPSSGSGPDYVLSDDTFEQKEFGLTRATEYCYWLTASNRGGESAAVGPSCATTDPTIPSPPLVGTT